MKIDFRYNYESGYEILYQQTRYYLNFAYTPNNSYEFLYDLDDIPTYNAEAYTFGKTYGLRDYNDLAAFYSGQPVTNLPDVNADTPTETFLDTSYSSHLNNGQYFWYKFTAPSLGIYTFTSFGSTNTYGELFLNPVVANSVVGRVTYDDNSATGNNFEINYEMEAGAIVYIRVRGYNWTATGPFSFMVTGQEIPITSAFLNNAYSGNLISNGVYWYEFTAQNTGQYIFETTGGTDTYGELFSNPVAEKTYAGMIDENDDLGSISNFRIIHQMSEGETIYIRVRGYHWTATGAFSFSVIDVKKATIVLDPINMVAHGTEVTMNGGIVGEFTIHKGFTRFINFNGSAPNVLLQDYNWSSNNSSVLSVDMYGIVTAHSYNITVPTLVTISCVYKYNPLFQGTITFIVYP